MRWRGEKGDRGPRARFFIITLLLIRESGIENPTATFPLTVQMKINL